MSGVDVCCSQLQSDSEVAVVNDSDDFEVVPDPSEEEQGSLALDLEIVNACTELELSHETIEEELTRQNAELSGCCKRLGEYHNEKINEVEGFKTKVACLEAQLEEQDGLIKELEQKLEEQCTLREEMDKVTAQLCRAQETIRYQDQTIREFQTEGFVSVQPPMLADTMLAAEIASKDSRIVELERAVDEIHRNVLEKMEGEEAWRKENEELRNLAAALQQQVDQDRADFGVLREEHAAEIAKLKEAMRRQESGRGASVPPGLGAHDDDSDTLRGVEDSEGVTRSTQCPMCAVVLPTGQDLEEHKRSWHCRLQTIE